MKPEDEPQLVEEEQSDRHDEDYARTSPAASRGMDEDETIGVLMKGTQDKTRPDSARTPGCCDLAKES